MYVRRRRTRIEIWTPAKLNLFLEVMHRRGDGYHEIETLMVPVNLFDTLEFTAPTSTVSDTKLTGTGSREDARLPTLPDVVFSSEWVPGLSAGGVTPPGEVPVGGENLVYRALDLLRRRASEVEGRELAGLEVKLRKRIPSAAGMGGGSSDAAAALLGANAWWQLGWSRHRLAELAAELGSDIPFFIWSVPAVCKGRGERVEPISQLPRMHFVVARPDQGLATAEVYRETRVPESPIPVESFLRTVRRGETNDWAPRMFNRLQEATQSVAPWMEDICRQFQRLDLPGHQLSGSGSAYFGICRNRKQACQAAAILRGRTTGRVYHVASVGGEPTAALQPSQN